ncbi:hypothetical protein JL722_4788 [Aureococcus anophagefferens]|nr:hypothetical protein JL722_4788 [Aureococcus anophagefferens]
MAATADLPAMLDKYRGQLGAVIQEVAAAPAEREPDYRLAHLEAAGAGADDAGPAAKIRLVAERKAYGIAPKKGVAAAEDASVLHIWRWEVVAAEAYFGDASLKAIRPRAGAAASAKAKALGKLVDARQGRRAKALAEEKVLKISRDEDAARLKAEAADRKKREKEAEKKAKEDAKALKKRESEDAKAAKKRESEDAREASAAKKKKVDDGASSASNGAPRAGGRRAGDAKTDAFVRAIAAARADPPPLESLRRPFAPRPPRSRAAARSAAYFHFHENFKPPSLQVVEASSAVVTATAPFAKDPAVDYDYDSDDDYAANEGEIEDGEDLSDDDGEERGRRGGRWTTATTSSRATTSSTTARRAPRRSARRGGRRRARAAPRALRRDLLLRPGRAGPDPDPEPEPKAKKPRKPKKSAEAAAPAPAPAAGAAPPAAAPDKPASSEKKKKPKKKEPDMTGQKTLTSFFAKKKGA